MARIFAPVTSFGQELHSALRAGADKRFEIPFDSEKMAIRFLQRLNSLRNAMKKENHPDWKQLYRCQGRREGKTIILAPADSDFRSALAKAGLDKVAVPPPTTVAPEVKTPEPGEMSVDSLFSDLVEITTLPSKDHADEQPTTKPELDQL